MTVVVKKKLDKANHEKKRVALRDNCQRGLSRP